jgi:hypothetical protein
VEATDGALCARCWHPMPETPPDRPGALCRACRRLAGGTAPAAPEPPPQVDGQTEISLTWFQPTLDAL